MIGPNMASFTVHGRQIRSIVTVSRHYCIGRLEDGVWGIGDIFVGRKYKNYETVKACYDTVYILHITHDTASPRLSFPGMGIPMLKIRQSRDRLIFNMGILILVSWHLDIETAPSSPVRYRVSFVRLDLCWAFKVCLLSIKGKLDLLCLSAAIIGRQGKEGVGIWWHVGRDSVDDVWYSPIFLQHCKCYPKYWH